MCTPSEHIRLKRPSVWPTLPYVGVQELGDEKAELRNCKTCHSTLAKEISDVRAR